jgi:hypothetical protein
MLLDIRSVFQVQDVRVGIGQRPRVTLISTETMLFPSLLVKLYPHFSVDLLGSDDGDSITQGQHTDGGG